MKSVGHMIPKVVVTSPDQRAYIASMSCKSMGKSKSFNIVNDKIEQALAGGDLSLPKGFFPFWSLANKKGFLPGRFVSLKNDSIVFVKQPDGKTRKIAMKKLSPASQAYARAFGAPAKPKEAPVTYEMESWTNAKGKSIEGKFVSLNGGKISLEKPDGEIVTFDVSLLSEASRKRAEELAKQ